MLELWKNNAPLCILIVILIVVVPLLIFYLVKAKREHPKGLIAAALSNMGERFGYYIMNAVMPPDGFMRYFISRFTFLPSLEV